MSQAYRLGFEFSAPEETSTADDARWSLAGVDPNARIRIGSFPASDGAAVPYRLWQAKTPRAFVLLLHGACDYSGAFDEIGPMFAARGFTALAIDQRGFGATSTRGKWRGKKRMIRDAVEAVLYLRKRYGSGLPVFILGESMGAALAVHVASRAADLDIAGLVLSAPGAISGMWRRWFGSTITRVLRFFAPNSGLVVERISAWDFTPAAAIRLLSDPMVLRRVRPAALFGLFKLSRSAVDEAEHVRVPALTMVGTKEDVLRLDCIRRLYDGLAGEKDWKTFEDGPHLLLHWQHNDRVLDKVFSWLEARLTGEPAAYKVEAANDANRTA
ncbi:MAG TPA: alpha/beta fold hydrolase [Rhizomicrobium sp.]|jgi:alpha-beta hydrolase superfamily lysophospholipase|nr:alpha/beta fold hydrolase [Rhizomicrobium sp.]